jgi:hypothetical protein
MGTVFSLSKSATSLALGVSEIALLVFGVLLVVGLIGEYAESEGWKRHTRLFELLVIIGVAGELIADGGVFLFSSHLQTISDGEIAILRDKASQEELRAAGLERDAAGARRDAETARKRADSFELDIANARKDAAVANARAAEANRTAETEKLARIKIEERLAGWKLSSEAQTRLVKKLKPYPETPFDLSVNPVESRFMETLDAVLSAAGWRRQEPKASSSQPGILVAPLLVNGKAAMNTSSGGIMIELPRELRKQSGAAADALAKGLTTEGIPATWGIIMRDTDTSALHIAIGAKE